MAPFDSSRRAALAALAGLAGAKAGAQTGADRVAHPTELIVPGGRGGPLDVSAIVLAEAMGRRWRQNVTLQHTTGAVSGALAVAKSPPDGSRIGMAAPSLSINAALDESLPYDTLVDLVPVCQLGSFEYGIFVNQSIPVRNVAELVAYVRAARTPVRYASPGTGTGSHLAAESFAYEAGLKMEHVPILTHSAAEKAVVAGQMPVLFHAIGTSIAESRRGPLRLVGLMGARSVADAAGVSSVAQVLPGFEFTGMLGVIAPKNTPPGMVRRLAQDIASMVMEPDIRKRLSSVGVDAVASSPDDFDARLRADIARWRLVGRIARIRLKQ